MDEINGGTNPLLFFIRVSCVFHPWLIFLFNISPFFGYTQVFLPH